MMSSKFLRTALYALLGLSLISGAGGSISTAHASNWLPIFVGEIRILIPAASLETVMLNKIMTDNGLVNLQVGSLIHNENIYYRRQSFTNGNWQNGVWQCQLGSEVSPSTNTFTIADIPSGLHRFEVGVCIAQSSCDTTSYNANSAYCSASKVTAELLSVDLNKTPTIQTQNSELHLTWPQVEGADEYKLEIYKNGIWSPLSDLNPTSTAVTPANYQAQINQTGYFNVGDLGNGYFDFRVKTCYKDNCSLAVSTNQQLAIAPADLSYVRVTTSIANLPTGEFKVIAYNSEPGRFILDVYPPIDEVSYYKITRKRRELGNDDVYTEPAIKSYIVTTEDALTTQIEGVNRLEFRLYSTEVNAQYYFKVDACYGNITDNLCSTSSDSSESFSTYIESNPSISGHLDGYVLGSKKITGQVAFSSSATGRMVYLKTTNHQILAQQAFTGTTNDFSFDNLDLMTGLSSAALPVELEIVAHSATLNLSQVLGHFTLTRYENPELIAVADTITVAKGGSSFLSLVGNDTFDADPLTIVIVEQPLAGTVTTTGINATYTAPNAYFSGELNFKYQLTDAPIGQPDAAKTSNIVTVNLTVSGDNTSPVANPDTAVAQVDISDDSSSNIADKTPSAENGISTLNVSNRQTLATNQTITIDVLGNDKDDDNNDLMIVPDIISGIHGNVAISADGKSLHYTPANNQIEDDAFYYRATDGKGGISKPTLVKVGIQHFFPEMPTRIWEKNDGVHFDFTLTALAQILYPKVEYKLVNQTWSEATQVHLSGFGYFIGKLSAETYHFRSALCVRGRSCQDFNHNYLSYTVVGNGAPPRPRDNHYALMIHEPVELNLLHGKFGASDPDGEAVSLVSVSCDDANDCPTVNSADTVLYTPQTMGDIEFTYTAQDERGNTADAKILVTVIDNTQFEDSSVLIQPANTPGAMTLSSKVTHKGKATIHIPLPVAPGVNNLRPNLSLNYASTRTRLKEYKHKGEDIIGDGWHFAGLSQIDKCGRFTERNIPDADVAWESLCLDGQPLTHVGLARSGAPATDVFFQWNNTNVKVIKHYPSGHPGLTDSWLEVFLPDGSIIEYGRTADSRHVNQTSDLTNTEHRVSIPLSPFNTDNAATDNYFQKVVSPEAYNGYSHNNVKFRINKKTDEFGNTITYQYYNNNDFGFNYPLRISYGSKLSGVLDSHIDFEYEPRSQQALADQDTERTHPDYDTDVNYFIEMQAISPVRLNKLIVMQAGKKITDYRLQTTAIEDGWERLKQVQQCGYDEAGGVNEYGMRISCVEPLTFGWDTSSPRRIESRVNHIDNGSGITTQFEYTDMTKDGVEGNALSTGPAITWPFEFFNLQGVSGHQPNYFNGYMYTVVTAKVVSDGVGDSNRFEYAYQGRGLLHETSGWGFAGFDTTLEWDVSNDIYTYNQHTFSPIFVNKLANSIQTKKMFGQPDASILSKKVVEMDFLKYEIKDPQVPLNTEIWVPYGKALTEYLYAEGELLGVKQTSKSFTVGSSECIVPSYDLCRITDSVETQQWADGATSDPSSNGPNKPVSLSNITRSIKTTKGFQSDMTAGQWLQGFNHATTVSYYDGDTNSAPSHSQQYSQSPYLHLGKKINRVGSTSQLTDSVDNSLALFTTYAFDHQGNPSSTTVSGDKMAERATTLTHYRDGRYPTTITNALSQSATYGYDSRFGLVNSITDANQQLTRHKYDPFARLISTTTADDTVTTQYQSCDGETVVCSIVANITTPSIQVTTTSETSESVVYLDNLGRQIRQQSQGFNGTAIFQDTLYNSKGQLWKQSLPYYPGETVQYTVYFYDGVGRIENIMHPDATISMNAYTVDTGLKHKIVTQTTTVKDADGVLQNHLTQVTSRHTHYNGDLIKIIEAQGSTEEVTTEFTYYPTGWLHTSTVDGHLMATLTYDAAGNRTLLEDANIGTVSHNYSAFNQLNWQKTNDTRLIDYDYDLLGRLKTQTTADGEQTTVYDPANGIGGIDYVEFADADSDYYHKQDYRYNSDSRVEGLTTAIAVAGLSRSYAQSMTYDHLGRLETITYPNNEVISQDYNRWGYATGVTDANDSALQQIIAINAFGAVTDETFANELTTTRVYDSTSNLLQSITTSGGTQQLNYGWASNGLLERREDALAGQTERFDYDSLHRLKNSYVAHNGIQVQHQQQSYNLLGNIESKQTLAGVGDSITPYAYGDLDRTQRNAGINAVKSATINGVAYQLHYNSHGEIRQYLPSSSAGASTTIDWNHRGKPKLISKGNNSESFAYGIDGARYYRQSQWQDNNGTSHTEHTFYAPGIEEVITGDDDHYQRIEKIAVAADVLKIYAYGPNSQVDERYEYSHRDHLGSIDKVTDGDGNILLTTSFNSFGQRRGLDWQGELSGQDYKDLLKSSGIHVSLGFTGHEMLDMVGLIHMNGRVYDPTLGRFLSPDPFIQAPELSQSYNRYSYVMNNPLSLTDPTGYFWDSCWFSCADGETSGWDNISNAWDDFYYDTLGFEGDYCEACRVSITDLPSGEDAGWHTDDSVSLGVGLTTAGVIADIYTAAAGEDFFTNDGVSGFWRYAGIIPFVSEIRKLSHATDAAEAGISAMRKGDELPLINPTYAELQGLNKGLQAHHILPVYLGKMLGHTKKSMNAHPATSITQFAHTGKSNSNAMHKAISGYLPPMVGGKKANYSASQIRIGLQSAYNDIGRPELFNSISHLIK
ncbi:MAG: RHS repeat-associated protein [Phenylobacterium sp.]|jgi:RHS repeat-associated protein